MLPLYSVVLPLCYRFFVLVAQPYINYFLILHCGKSVVVMMLMRVQASVRRQHGLLSGARSLRRVARSLSPAGYKHQVSAPSNDWSNHVPNTTKNGFNALGLVQPIVDGIAAQGIA